MSEGGTRMEMPSLIGEFIIIFHFLISGIWSRRRRTVFELAVAVINSILPPRALSSPDERAMAGRKADFSLDFKPQLTTFKISILKSSLLSMQVHPIKDSSRVEINRKIL